ESSGIRANYTRASALSSPIWRVRPSASSPSATSAAQRSNGSRRARVRSSGRGYRAGPLPPTRCASSSTYWPTISVTYAHASDAQSGGAVVADQLAGKADQDRRQGCQPRAVRHVPHAEVAVWRQMFNEILSLITRLRAQPAPA